MTSTASDKPPYADGPELGLTPEVALQDGSTVEKMSSEWAKSSGVSEVTLIAAKRDIDDRSLADLCAIYFAA